jgi:hypothetical protein
MGPLGTLADKYFQKIMELASGLRVLPEIAATVPALAADIKKAANLEALDKSKDKPYGKFKIALFGADAEVNSTMQAKILKFEPAKPLAYKSQDQFGEINLSTKSQIALDATKQNLQFGSEEKSPKGSDKITLISDAKKQFSITGGGLRLSLGKEPMTMFAPKIIIPSLQKQLNAKDAKGNAVSANEEFVIEHLKIGEGAIKLKADDLKSALTQLRNNLITALNKKEDTTKTDSSIPNVSPK